MASGGYVIPFEGKMKCGICEKLIKDARSLPCGHTFCRDCLKRSESRDGTLSCAECRSSSRGAEQLPRCFVINGFLDALQETFGQGTNADQEVTIGKHGFQLEKNFSCAICLNLMTDPRYLPCGHSFCVTCLMGLHQSQETPGIVCSQCKVEHILPSQGVDGLPVGHRIKSIATEIKSNKGEPPEPPAKQPKNDSRGRRNNQTGDRRQARRDDIGDEKKRAQAQFQILLRQLSGKTVTIDIHPDANISDLENKVRDRTGVDPSQFGLTYNGRTCERTRSLRYYNISHHDTVNMTSRLAGGSAAGPIQG